jgi:hypothetical protein
MNDEFLANGSTGHMEFQMSQFGGAKIGFSLLITMAVFESGKLETRDF